MLSISISIYIYIYISVYVYEYVYVYAYVYVWYTVTLESCADRNRIGNYLRSSLHRRFLAKGRNHSPHLLTVEASRGYRTPHP